MADSSHSDLISGDDNKEGNKDPVVHSDDSDEVWGDGDELSDVSAISSDENFLDDTEMIDEDPFEPVYASPLAEDDGVVIEEVSLDNILPSGSRRLRKHT